RQDDEQYDRADERVRDNAGPKQDTTGREQREEDRPVEPHRRRRRRVGRRRGDPDDAADRVQATATAAGAGARRDHRRALAALRGVGTNGDWSPIVGSGRKTFSHGRDLEGAKGDGLHATATRTGEQEGEVALETEGYGKYIGELIWG